MVAYKKRNKKAKIAKISATIPATPTKTPRWIGSPNIENIYMAWRFSKADLGGPYHCRDFSHNDYRQLWERLRAFEGMNADTLKRTGSLHDIAINKLTTEAQARLAELELDDIDIIYSFHIDGPCRLWCIRFLNIFCVLWWDRNHGAYLVTKKHT